ncbi:MAG: DNA primase small subunit PriS [Candidatus Aenigmatarchaeota archaeon]
MDSKFFIKEKFQNFYQKDFTLNETAIREIEKREFAFNLFEGWMLRHKSFKNVKNLKTFISSTVPLDVYFSCAYYVNPEEEMDNKDWMGADLIFDIDADHIPTPCKKIHDTWICESCGFTGRGITPEKCPICNSEKFSTSTWPCEECLLSAKEETIKLLDILTQDFGLSETEIRTFFSGHRGYHVHIESETVKSLDATSRKEIVDYVTCQGFDLKLDSNSFKTYGSGNKWTQRINNELINFIQKATEDDLKDLGLKENIVRNIIKNKDALMRNLSFGAYEGVRGIGVKTLSRLIEHVTKSCSVKIDTVVTTDIHRLIRFPETLHGKTGLKKVEFSPSQIDTFDPLERALAFREEDEITIFISDAPKFRLGDSIYGPYRNKKATLPISVAILLICKGKAEVAK